MTAHPETELPSLESSAPDWALELVVKLPDSFRVLQPVELQRETDAARMVAAINQAGSRTTDWEMARRRIIARLLADGPYAGTRYLRVDFWRRRAVLEGVGDIAVAFYENRPDRLPALAQNLRQVDMTGLSGATITVALAAQAAAQGCPLYDVVGLVVQSAKSHCEDTRGPGAAIAVERLAATWATHVIIECLEQAHRPNAVMAQAD